MPKSAIDSNSSNFRDGVIVRYSVKASFVIELSLDKPLGDLRRILAENLDNQIEAAGGIETFIDEAKIISVSDSEDLLLADDFEGAV